jgi:hypothetical protein
MSVDKINLAPITNNSDVQLWYKYSSGGMLSEYDALQYTKGCHRIHPAFESAINILNRYNRKSRNSLVRFLEITSCTPAEVLDQVSHG